MFHNAENVKVLEKRMVYGSAMMTLHCICVRAAVDDVTETTVAPLAELRLDERYLPLLELVIGMLF